MKLFAIVNVIRALLAIMGDEQDLVPFEKKEEAVEDWEPRPRKRRRREEE